MELFTAQAWLAARAGEHGYLAGTDAEVIAWQALRYALAKLAIDFVSGPGAIASVLRTGLLDAPFSTRSVPLDVGYSATIPEPIRRAVILRDQHCAWPGGHSPPPPKPPDPGTRRQDLPQANIPARPFAVQLAFSLRLS